jgi:hypothetical protein
MGKIKQTGENYHRGQGNISAFPFVPEMTALQRAGGLCFLNCLKDTIDFLIDDLLRLKVA